MRRQVQTILCVHPNGELYGSDRVFLQVLRSFKARWPEASITVLLPFEGALSLEARNLVDDVRIERLAVLRRSQPLSTVASLLFLPIAIARARSFVRAYDFVYISTVIALDYLIASRWARGPVLIHVHELPVGNVQQLMASILSQSRGFFIFISRAVRDAFPQLALRGGVVIWNGVRAFEPVRRLPCQALKVMLIGRFNTWKGQALLIEAIAQIPAPQRSRLKVRLVGSAYVGQEHFQRDASLLIARLGLADCIEIFDFIPNPEQFYAWADVVVVPSTRPEPFGLVAIEAMSASCATIAADHGGLSEIVVDGVTGRLVPPSEIGALADALLEYLDNPQLARAHGAAGRRRFEQCFDERCFLERIADVAAERLTLGSEARPRN